MFAMPPNTVAGCLRIHRLEFLGLDHRLMYLAQEFGPRCSVWGLEQLQATDVHGVLAGFGQQEHRIRRRDEFHACPLHVLRLFLFPIPGTRERFAGSSIGNDNRMGLTVAVTGSDRRHRHLSG